MLADGRGYLRSAPWVAFLPGLSLMIVVLRIRPTPAGAYPARVEPHLGRSCEEAGPSHLERGENDPDTADQGTERTRR